MNSPINPESEQFSPSFTPSIHNETNLTLDRFAETTAEFSFIVTNESQPIDRQRLAELASEQSRLNKHLRALIKGRAKGNDLKTTLAAAMTGTEQSSHELKETALLVTPVNDTDIQALVHKLSAEPSTVTSTDDILASTPQFHAVLELNTVTITAPLGVSVLTSGSTDLLS
ncbi:hypothetical protein I4J47_02930 [Corynebacterium belfantii]|uniref:hypothetical protein n=1 Tax=Corynebacterium belfantii TaxID=2014537 RepID=UPI0018D28D73|nr:hypothetical protein [Corynebacterium belfantii]MBG9330390.1 hypothetical protein [Corynebacterium belfantii]